jgi:ribosomal-protein-alanine N-acetyltransferase
MLYPINFPTIELNKEIILREQKYDDAANFFTYISDPVVNKYILAPIPKTFEEAKEDIIYWIDLYYQKRGIYWAISEKNTQKMIGAIGFHDINHINNRAEISYDLSSSYWQQGIMTIALEKIIEFGFKNLQLERIQASTIKENIASIKLLEKNNFTYEGCLRHYRKHKNKYYNIEFYSILANDRK